MARSAHQFQEISRDVRDEQKVKDRAHHCMYFCISIILYLKPFEGFLLSCPHVLLDFSEFSSIINER
jgi:hypothetical protein